MRKEKRVIKGPVAAKRRLGHLPRKTEEKARQHDKGQVERMGQRLQGIHSPRPKGEQPEHAEAAGQLHVL